MEVKIDRKKIELSLVACRVIMPYMPNPMNDIQHQFASKIMDRMLKKG